nr:Chain P, PEPTIDE (FSHPQNT) [synthetic construct]1SLG_M Chain M, FCHPQNT1SLG_P Chain P, FCHPQNT1VWA_M Chain M, PEPTIDE LIGAND CONTAINING HPQ1VWA_P Chain P, PEPTIDE LIGAND CONTAINING HPQ
FSHPQNT